MVHTIAIVGLDEFPSCNRKTCLLVGILSQMTKRRWKFLRIIQYDRFPTRNQRIPSSSDIGGKQHFFPGKGLDGFQRGTRAINQGNHGNVTESVDLFQTGFGHRAKVDFISCTHTGCAARTGGNKEKAAVMAQLSRDHRESIECLDVWLMATADKKTDQRTFGMTGVNDLQEIILRYCNRCLAPRWKSDAMGHNFRCKAVRSQKPCVCIVAANDRRSPAAGFHFLVKNPLPQPRQGDPFGQNIMKRQHKWRCRRFRRQHGHPKRVLHQNQITPPAELTDCGFQRG